MNIKTLRQLTMGRKRSAVAGILAGIILFTAIFAAGFGFLLFVSSSTQNANQANLQRAGMQQQAGNEKLLVTANLTSVNNAPCKQCLWLKATNTGGVPSTVTDVYVTYQSGPCQPGVCQPGQLVSNSVAAPPSHFLRSSPADLNVSLPYTLDVGTTMKDQISSLAFTYSPGEHMVVSLLTSAGNVFSAQYPAPPMTSTTYVAEVSVSTNVQVQQVAGGPQLSLMLTATTLCPDGTSGCTQTFSCSNGCITVTATVYNLATAPATGVSVTLQTPFVGGTASVTQYSTPLCTFPGGVTTATIPASSGSGPGVATATCEFSASTGQTGGLASFSGSASGNIGFSVTSAEALSNSVEIGGLSSVTTQGAFVTNFFFLEYSSCYQNTGGNFNSARGCTLNANPMTLSNLPSGNFLAAGSNFYVAFYVEVTNLLNKPLPILQYSYTYGDPSASGETYIFLAGVNNTAFMTNGQVYYPTYGSTPTLTAYPTNCNQVNANNVPTNPNCIYVDPGQTVTLTFAACGYGSANWAWGSHQDAQGFDNSNGCTGGPPDFIAPEEMPLGIVLSYVYNGQDYSQLMAFEGQQLIRSSSTSVACSPSSFAAGTPTTCTATVHDTDGVPKGASPVGKVKFSDKPLGLGTFSSTTCNLSFGSCSVTYTPNLATQGAVAILANYQGDSRHEASSNSTSITVLDPTTTSVTGACKGASVLVNTQTLCTVTIVDNTGGTVSTPAGTVTMTDSPSGSGTFGTCTLSQVVLGTASCTVSYTPSPGKEGSISITATYNGDSKHAGSSGSTGLKATTRASSISVTCAPNPDAVSAGTVCTATVTDTSPGTPITPTGGTVTFSQSGSGTGTFSPATTCTTASGTCQVTFTPSSGSAGKTATITASYAGDTDHSSSGPSSGFIVNIIKASPTVTVVCSGSTCTATLTGYGGTVTGETITFSKTAGTGAVSFPSGSTCTLSASGACSVTVTGSTAGSVTITASYPGDTNNNPESGNTVYTVYAPTVTVSCTGTTCTATLTGYGGTVTGETITFSKTAGAGAVSFPSGATCALSSSGTCSVTVTGTSAGTITLTASYPGDWDNIASSGSTAFTVHATTTTVVCSPATLGVGSTTTCTATLTGYGGTVTGETITFSKTAGAGAVSFPSGATCALSSSGTCSVTVKGTTAGTATLTAAYGGDYLNIASSGTTSLTISHNAFIVQGQTLCQGTGVTQPCTVTLSNPVTAGDVLVVVVTTERTGGTTCRTATVADSLTGTLTAGTTAQASAGSGSSGDCVYVRVFYVTIGSSGSDQVTVTLSRTTGLSSEVVQAYELSGVATTPTGPAGASCNSGCSATLQTSSFSYSANSFLVAAGSLYGNYISSGPANFVNDRVGTATGNGDYVGHLIPGSAGSSTFSMTASSAPTTWAEVVVQFAAA